MSTPKPAWRMGGKFTAEFAPIYSESAIEHDMYGSIVVAEREALIGFEFTVTAPDGATAVLRSRGTPYFLEMTAGSSGDNALTQLMEAANGASSVSEPGPTLIATGTFDPGDDCHACIERFGEQGLCPDSCAGCGGLHCPAIDCDEEE